METVQDIPADETLEESETEPITKASINALIQASNIVDKLKDLKKLSRTVVDEYDMDEKSREKWIEVMKEASELARQLYDKKIDATGAIVSNVKMPVIASAIIQFSSRAYPNIVKGRNVVKGKVIGRDEGGLKEARGQRLSSYMNTQILDLMDDWESETDLLLTLLALYGAMFRKIYYDFPSKQTKSDLILPDDLVTHFYAKSFEPRTTHKVYLTQNEIEGKIRANEFIKHDFEAQSNTDDDADKDGEAEGENKKRDYEDTARGILYLEQHRWWDITGDGYQDPCIVTVHYGTEEVVRVVPRFDIDGVVFGEDGKITSIKPISYFVKYTFMRAIDGSFYETGFGTLLSPICRTINTTTNQLIDAGTAANNGGGFIGSGLRLGKSGSVKFRRDEYHRIPSSGNDFAKSILPFPFKPPSMTLFKLLGLMMEQADKLASMSDLMAGQNPPKDQPATTTLALIEQGLKVFGAVFKRVFLALKKEFAMIYRLNSMYLTDEGYQNILDDPAAFMADWEGESKDIVPISDEAELTDVQRSLKAQMLMGMKQPYNAREIEGRFYESMGIENWQKLLPPEGYKPPVDPEVEIKQQELQLKAKELEIKEKETMMIIVERKNRALSLYADAVKTMADAQATEDSSKIEHAKLVLESVKLEMDVYDRSVGGNGNGQGMSERHQRGSVSLLENKGPNNAAGNEANAGKAG